MLFIDYNMQIKMKIILNVIYLLIFIFSLAANGQTMLQRRNNGIVHRKEEVKALFKKLIELEDDHDLKAVRLMMWESPDMLFVSKKPKNQGNYGAYWGTNVAISHFRSLYNRPVFRIEPDYSKEKEVILAPDVVETYVPIVLTTLFEDGKPVESRPFILIMQWVMSSKGFKLATDVALPVPR